MTGTEIIPKASIIQLAGARDRALAAYAAAAERIAAANTAAKTVATAPGLGRYIPIPTLELSTHRQSTSAETYRKEVDRAFWLHVMDKSGLGALMGAKQKEAWRDTLDNDPPAFEIDTVAATFDGLRASAGSIFRQSIVDVFERLPRAYRSHDGFKFGARIVQEYAVSRWSGKFSWVHRSRGCPREALDDLDRAFHLLDGRPQAERISDTAAAAMSRGDTEHEGAYFRLRWFRNGNLHIWLRREDLTREANRLLADHYGAQLGRMHLHPDQRAA